MPLATQRVVFASREVREPENQIRIFLCWQAVSVRLLRSL